MKKINPYFLILFFSLIFFLYGKPASTEEAPSGFSITPFYQSIDLEKDQARASFAIDVKNTTGAPAVFRLSVLDFGTLNESGGVAFLGSSDNLKYSLASWVSLPNDTLVLAPGEEKKIDGVIENRESLSPGGHYGAVFFKIDDGSSINGDKKEAVAFDPSLASLLFVRKTGGEIYGLNLNSSEYVKNVFRLPAQIKLRFQNTGNVHVTPRGTVEIFDPRGKLISKSIINSESGIIMPETFRIFSGKFMPISQSFIPGRYTALTNYRYDGQDNFIIEKSSFFFIPLNFVGLLVLAVGLIMGIVIFYKKKK